MRFRVLISVLITCFSSSSALADSFCGFDQGLVGTKAIGFVSPYQLSTVKYEADQCELEGFDAASDEALSTVFNCTDFQHLPSPYVDSFEDEGFNPLGSDYFHLQVMDAKENWAYLLLKSGDKKWVKKKNFGDFNFPYQFKTNETSASVTASYPTQASFYSEPSFSKPDSFHGSYARGLSDFWIDTQILPDFFNSELFRTLEKYGIFNPDHIETAKLATHYGEFLHVSYDVTNIIRDEEGREWLKAQEVLELSYHDIAGYIYEKLKDRKEGIAGEVEGRIIDLFWDNHRSKPGRVVYIPYREPSGTITMVMTDGPNCGC